MASGVGLGTGVVTVWADESKFRESLQKMPEIARQQIDITVREIQERMRKVNLKLQVATDPAAIASLNHQLEIQELRLNQVKSKAITMGEGLSGGGSRGAQALYQLGAAVDDLQYGFRGILNNIPQIVMAFGSAGLAGAVSIAVTAVYQLYSHWDDLMEIMGKGRVLSEAEAMKKLADQTSRSATEQERLTKAKRQESTIASQGSARPKILEESARKTREALTEHGSETIREALKHSGLAPADAAEKSRLEDQIAGLEEKRALFSTLGKTVADPLYFDKAINDLRKQITDLEDTATAKYLADVENNEKGRREQLTKEIEQHLENYGKGTTDEQKTSSARVLLRNLKQSAPDAIKESEQRKHEADAELASIWVPEEREIEKLAGFMAKGVIGNKLLKDPKSDISADIVGALREMGYSSEYAERVKARISPKIGKQVAADTDAYIGQHNVSAETARKELLEKREEDERQPRTRKARKAATEREQLIEQSAAALAKGNGGKKLLSDPKANVMNEAIADIMARSPGASILEAAAAAGLVIPKLQGIVDKRVADKRDKMPAGTTREQAAAAVLREDNAKEHRRSREARERIQDAQERVHDTHERVHKAWMGGQKSQVMGVHEFINQQMTSSLNSEDRQKELYEAMKDSAKAERELTDAIEDLSLTAKAAP